MTSGARDPFDWQAVYPPGVDRSFEPPDTSLWRRLDIAAERTPQAPAVVEGGRCLSYAELRDRAWAAADGTFSHVHAGERVLLVLPNRHEFVTCAYGAMRAGLIVVPASPQLTSHELAAVTQDCDPRVAVVEPSRVAEVATLVDGRVVACDSDDLRARSATERPHGPHADLAVLQYTSGTTGAPRAAEMSHRNLVANALQNNLWFGWRPDDVVLGALPLCHTWGLCCVMSATIAAGASMVLVDQFDAAAVLAAVERERVTVIYGSATMFHRLLDAAGPRAADAFRSVRYVKAGAMLVGADLPARWSAAVPDVPMVAGYGLTEASPEVADNPLHRPRAGTVGVPLPGTSVRICDPDALERELSHGSEGEIQVRGPQVTRGYWRRPEATAEAILPGGWLRTGDLGRLDDEGYLVVVDRLKDLIKFRGWSVVPAEVERALRTHPDVDEVVVVGAPDPVDGEVPVAFVRLRAGVAPDEDALRAHVVALLASYKRPRAYRFVDEIPRNHVGKPLRRVLRERQARGSRLEA